ncbi:MAG: type VI secretion system-associated protein TagF [bacterium]
MSTATFELGYFGKLPIYEEFLRHNAEWDEVRFIEQWLHQGIHTGELGNKEAWELSYQRAPAYNFLLRLKGNRRFLVGTFVFSRDRGGREYPFAIFLTVDHKKFNMHQIFMPIIFTNFLEKAAGLANDGWRECERQELLTRFQELGEQIPARPQTYQDKFLTFLNSRTTCEFWHALFGSFEDTRKYLVYQNLRQILLPLRQRKVQKFSLGLRFPLVQQDDREAFEITFWLYLAARLAGDPLSAPLLFWNIDRAHPAAMLLFLQPPMPESVKYLLQPESEDERLCVLDRDGKVHPEGLTSTVRNLMDAPNLKLVEWLRAIEKENKANQNGQRNG